MSPIGLAQRWYRLHHPREFIDNTDLDGRKFLWRGRDWNPPEAFSLSYEKSREEWSKKYNGPSPDKGRMSWWQILKFDLRRLFAR